MPTGSEQVIAKSACMKTLNLHNLKTNFLETQLLFSVMLKIKPNLFLFIKFTFFIYLDRGKKSIKL